VHRRIPPHQQARRTLRLFMVAGTGAAGLCLVVGSVTLVASVSEPPRSATLMPASRQSSTGKPDPARGPGPRGAELSPAGVRTVLTVTGRGSAISRRFTIGGTGTWQLRWAYRDCHALGRTGGFVVASTGKVTSAVLSRFGTSGHGFTWAYQDPGRQRLVISSECAWSIRVVGQQ
jgi:hypothetical protein